jgi:hypothetical protein
MLGDPNVIVVEVLLVRLTVPEGTVGLKGTEVVLGVSVAPLLDEPYVKERLMVPVTAGVTLVEVRVTVAVYVLPLVIPELLTTEKYKVVGVVNAPLTPSQP